MLDKIKIRLGIRSRCCGAKIETWHAGKDICAECHNWVRKDISAEAIKALQGKKTTAQPKLRRAK